MVSQINGTIPATNADLLSAPVRSNFAIAQSEITALQNGQFSGPAPSPPAIAGTVIATAFVARVTPHAGPIELGFNCYNADDGSAHYVDNGPAALINVKEFTAAGVEFPRMSFNVAANNTAGPGAPLPIGALPAMDIIFGAPGGPIAPFVVLGNPGVLPPATQYPLANTLICDQLAVQLGTVGSPPVGVQSRIMLNSYVDNNGTSRYLENGPAALIATHHTNPGTGTEMTILNFGTADINTQGPGAVCAFGGSFNMVFGPQGTSPDPTLGGAEFCIVGGRDFLPSVVPNYGSLLARGIVSVAADPLRGPPPSPDRVARLAFNLVEINSTGPWVTWRDGPGAVVTTHDANQGAIPLPYANLSFAVVDAQAAGTQYSFAAGSGPGRSMALVSGIGQPNDSTVMFLGVNRGGTWSVTQVMLGAPGSGGGANRALVVPN